MRIPVMLACLWLISGCSLFGGNPPAGVVMQYLESEAFDRQLSAALADDVPFVSVEMVGPASVNAVPPRLDRWLATVADYNPGAVKAEPDPAFVAERNLSSIAVTLMLGAYQMLQEHMLYRPCKDYDVSVLYVPGEGRITRVVFIRRPPAREKPAESDAAAGPDAPAPGE